METNKAYFLDVEQGTLHELSSVKKRQLEKEHPNWVDYNLEDDRLSNVAEFFQKHGKLLASPKQSNLFAGFTA